MLDVVSRFPDAEDVHFSEDVSVIVKNRHKDRCPCEEAYLVIWAGIELHKTRAQRLWCIAVHVPHCRRQHCPIQWYDLCECHFHECKCLHNFPLYCLKWINAYYVMCNHPYAGAQCFIPCFIFMSSLLHTQSVEISNCIHVGSVTIIQICVLQGYSVRRAFIAAQAPMEATRTDVWEVIWLFGASMIVLLCQPEEDGQVCRNVWCVGGSHL